MNERHFRLYERIVAIEDSLEALGPIDKLIEQNRGIGEDGQTDQKLSWGLTEACKYIGVSESLLYKLTAAKEVPHYKPRGKMLYFNREEIDKWLLQNKQEVIGMVTKIEIDNPERMKMEENNKHVQPNSKEEGVQRLNRILSESLIKATDTYKTPPQIIWVDNSSIATLGNQCFYW